MGNTIYVVNFSKNYHRNIKNNYLSSTYKCNFLGADNKQ